MAQGQPDGNRGGDEEHLFPMRWSRQAHHSVRVVRRRLQENISEQCLSTPAELERWWEMLGRAMEALSKVEGYYEAKFK